MDLINVRHEKVDLTFYLIRFSVLIQQEFFVNMYWANSLIQDHVFSNASLLFFSFIICNSTLFVPIPTRVLGVRDTNHFSIIKSSIGNQNQTLCTMHTTEVKLSSLFHSQIFYLNIFTLTHIYTHTCIDERNNFIYHSNKTMSLI